MSLISVLKDIRANQGPIKSKGGRKLTPFLRNSDVDVLVRCRWQLTCLDASTIQASFKDSLKLVADAPHKIIARQHYLYILHPLVRAGMQRLAAESLAADVQASVLLFMILRPVVAVESLGIDPPFNPRIVRGLALANNAGVRELLAEGESLERVSEVTDAMDIILGYDPSIPDVVGLSPDTTPALTPRSFSARSIGVAAFDRVLRSNLWRSTPQGK